MILVYTGNGKGKTCACVGQAVRALGQGMAVAFGQFMKRQCGAGEQRLLAQLLGPDFCAAGPGFLRDEAERPAHRQAALTLLAWARERQERADMLVLDEALYALNAGLVSQAELTALLDGARRLNRHLVLSGRGAPDWLTAGADLVTEMAEIKHPWRAGIAAQPGIEF